MNETLKRVLYPIRVVRHRYLEARQNRRLIAFLQRGSRGMEEVPVRDGEVGLVVCPWPPFTLLTDFVLALAMAFRLRGRKVRIIYDDTPFDPDVKADLRLQQRIAKLLSRLPPGIPVVRLSECAAADDLVLPHSEIQGVAELNTYRQFLSETPPPEAKAFHAHVETVMKETASRIQTLLRRQHFEYIVVPGGIYRTSGLFMRIGKRLGVRTASFDSGATVLLLSTDGVAAYQDDIPRAFAAIPHDGDGWVIAEAKIELRKRMVGKDAFASQQEAAKGAEKDVGILIPLNQSFDTAALGRHGVFKNQTEWMLETVAWIHSHTLEKVVVRRHPVERFAGMRSRDDYEGLLRERFTHHARVRYVRAEDQVNTYDLLAGARLVLPHTSTVGVEAAALGISVVTQSQSYYADLGFVWKAKTRKEYFELIARALAGELKVSDAQKRDAWHCYYLSQGCSFLPSSFTPGNIVHCVTQDPRSVLLAPENDRFFESVDANTPLALATYRFNRDSTVRSA